MPLPTESVTQAGSGLTFINYYADGVSDAYRGAIIAAEHQLQSLFTDQITTGVHFDLRPLDGNFAGHNFFSVLPVTYAQFVAALQAHATTADDFAAIAGLPSSDPSNGA